MTIVLGIILGVALAFCFAYMVTMTSVAKSNVLGDTKGTFTEFTRKPLRMISRSDGINPRNWVG